MLHPVSGHGDAAGLFSLKTGGTNAYTFLEMLTHSFENEYVFVADVYVPDSSNTSVLSVKSSIKKTKDKKVYNLIEIRFFASILRPVCLVFFSNHRKTTPLFVPLCLKSRISN